MDLKILNEFNFDTETKKTVLNDDIIVDNITDNTVDEQVKPRTEILNINGEELVIHNDIEFDNILIPTLICERCHKPFQAASFKNKLCLECLSEKKRTYEQTYNRTMRHKVKKKRKVKDESVKKESLTKQILKAQNSRTNLVRHGQEYQLTCRKCGKTFTACDIRTCYCANCYTALQSDHLSLIKTKKALAACTSYHYPGHGPVECRGKNWYEGNLFKILQYCNEEFTYQDKVYPLDDGYVFIPRIYRPQSHCYYEIMPSVLRRKTIQNYINKYKDNEDYIPVKILSKHIYNQCIRAFQPYIDGLEKSDTRYFQNKKNGIWKTCPCCGQIFFAKATNQICVNSSHYRKYSNMKSYQEQPTENIIIEHNDEHAKLRHFLNDILRFD